MIGWIFLISFPDWICEKDKDRNVPEATPSEFEPLEFSTEVLSDNDPDDENIMDKIEEADPKKIFQKRHCSRETQEKEKTYKENCKIRRTYRKKDGQEKKKEGKRVNGIFKN